MWNILRLISFYLLELHIPSLPITICNWLSVTSTLFNCQHTAYIYIVYFIHFPSCIFRFRQFDDVAIGRLLNMPVIAKVCTCKQLHSALPSPHSPLKYPSIISAAICEIFSFKYLCAYTAWKFVLYVVGDVHVSGRVRSVLSRVK